MRHLQQTLNPMANPTLSNWVNGLKINHSRTEKRLADGQQKDHEEHRMETWDQHRQNFRSIMVRSEAHIP